MSNCFVQLADCGIDFRHAPPFYTAPDHRRVAPPSSHRTPLDATTLAPYPAPRSQHRKTYAATRTASLPRPGEYLRPGTRETHRHPVRPQLRHGLARVPRRRFAATGPFPKPSSSRMAVKAINHLGHDAMKALPA